MTEIILFKDEKCSRCFKIQMKLKLPWNAFCLEVIWEGWQAKLKAAQHYSGEWVFRVVANHWATSNQCPVLLLVELSSHFLLFSVSPPFCYWPLSSAWEQRFQGPVMEREGWAWRKSWGAHWTQRLETQIKSPFWDDSFLCPYCLLAICALVLNSSRIYFSSALTCT